MKVLRDWSGVAAVMLLLMAIVSAEVENSRLRGGSLEEGGGGFADATGPVGAILMFLAGLAFAVCWYNLSRLASELGTLTRWQSIVLMLGGVAFIPVALTLEGFDISGRPAFVILGLALIAAGWTIFRTPAFPNAFAAVSGVAAIAVLIGTAMGEDGVVGPLFLMMAWAVLMSIMSIGWGHPDELAKEVIPMKLRSTGE